MDSQELRSIERLLRWRGDPRLDALFVHTMQNRRSRNQLILRAMARR